jgi:hypothetical protein
MYGLELNAVQKAQVQQPANSQQLQMQQGLQNQAPEPPKPVQAPTV